MKNLREEKIKRDMRQELEETANTVAYITALAVCVMAFIVVVGFLDGTLKDWIILAALVFGYIMRRLEKKTIFMIKNVLSICIYPYRSGVLVF